MDLRKLSAAIAALLAAALCVCCLAGCAQQEAGADAATQNRSYMAAANTAMMKLNADLEPFNVAVAEGDTVTMEQAAAQAYRDIEAFKEISAPEAMKDIHAEYCAGCDDLKQAMESYVQLYREEANLDTAEVNSRLAAIQGQYDSGIAHLQKGDQLVTELPGAQPSSSSSSAQ